MDNKDTDKLLQQLHDEINTIQSVDDEGRKLLEDLDGDIRQLIKRTSEESLQVHPTLFRRLDEAIHYFEITHPELTELLARVMSDLSNAGV